MDELFLGMDVGGTKCAVVLSRAGQRIRLLDKIKFPTEKGFQATFDALCAACREITERNGFSLQQVRGVGISCGGPLDSRRGVVLCPPNLPEWVDIPITRLVEEALGIPAYLQNDANACALG